jgi:hypothetical protein
VGVLRGSCEDRAAAVCSCCRAGSLGVSSSCKEKQKSLVLRCWDGVSLATLEQWEFQDVLATSTDASERIIVNVGHTKFWERIGNKIKIEKKNRKIDVA